MTTDIKKERQFYITGCAISIIICMGFIAIGGANLVNMYSNIILRADAYGILHNFRYYALYFIPLFMVIGRGIAGIAYVRRCTSDWSQACLVSDVTVMVLTVPSAVFNTVVNLINDHRIYMNSIIMLVVLAISMVDILFWLRERRISSERTGAGNGSRVYALVAGPVVTFVLVSIVCLLLGMIAHNDEAARINSTGSGDFKAFTMMDFEGNEVSQNVFEGHSVTMINIWTTFCGPCIEEMQYLQEISEMYDESSLQIIGVAADLYENMELSEGQVKLAKDIINKTGVEYLMLMPSLDIQNGILRALDSFPTTFFVDQNGNIICTKLGASGRDEWIEYIDGVIIDEERIN